MRRFARLRWVLLGLVLLLVVALVGARLYLASDAASSVVANRLAKVYGGPVRVHGVQVGLGTSSLTNVQFLPASGEETPWATVVQAKADVSLWDLLHGNVMPHRLTLRGLDVTLHFDRDGHLLTQLPDTSSDPSVSLPAVRLEGAILHLHQEGRPPMNVHGIDADVQAEGDEMVLKGSVADPFWEHWDLGGRVHRRDRTGSVELKTAHAHATMEKLRPLPYVSSKVWEQVELEGDTPVDFVFRAEKGDRYHYHIALEPRNTALRLPLIDLSAQQCRARMEIDDGVIRLRKGTGQVAGGTLQVDGVLDYMSDPSKIDVQAAAKDLDVKKLPAKWGLPPELEGKLTGSADLHVRIVNGDYQTSGEGKGVINEAKVAGLPAEPIELRLHTEGKGYQLQPKQMGALLPAHSERPLVRVAQRFPSLPALLVLAAQAPAARPARPAMLDLPLRWLNGFIAGLGEVLNRATRATDQALKYFPAPGPRPDEKAAEAGPPPSYLTANLKLNDVDVQQLAERLQLQLPFRVAGQLSFQVTADLPVNTVRDLKAYRLHGTATAKRLVLEDLVFANVTARVAYENGVLRLEELRGAIPDAKRAPGGFAGSAQYQFIPQGDLTAQLSLTRVPLAQAGRLLKQLGGVFEGVASGNVRARVVQGNLSDLNAWDANGELTSPHAAAYGLGLDDISAKLRMVRGVASLTDVRGRLGGSLVSGSAEMTLTEPYPFQANAGLSNFSLVTLNRLAPEFRPPVEVNGSVQLSAKVQGSLKPLVWTAGGSLNAGSLRLRDFTIKSLAATWQADRDRLTLTDIRGNLYDGEITGKSVIPLRSEVEGSVKLAIKDLDTAALSKAVPAIPLHLQGKANGSIDGALAAGAPNRPRTFNAKVELAAPRLVVQNVPADKLHGSVTYSDQKVTYELTGETLGGTFELNGSVPTTEPVKADQQGQGHLRIRDVRLGRMIRSLNRERDTTLLRGLFSLDLTYTQQSLHQPPIGRGTFRIQRLAWGELGDLSTGELVGGVLLRDGEMRLQNVSGSVGQGYLRAGSALNYRHPERSWIFVGLDGVDAGRLLSPWPELSTGLTGTMDVRLRLSLGRVWRGEGTIVFARGRYQQLELTDVRLPFTVHYLPLAGVGEIEIRDSRGNLALGRLTGNARISLGAAIGVRGSLSFSEVDLRSLIGQLGSTSQLGSGRLHGRADFSGDDVRSLNDLNADVYAKLEQAQPFQMPVLSQVLPFMGPGQSNSSTFTSGDLRGRLGRGVFRIQQLSLSGNSMQLYVDGAVTLQGRLDLVVLAQTQNIGSPSVPFLRFIGLKIPATGMIPLSVVLEASNYLANRLIHLRVTGTIRSPTIQVEPVSLLTQEAVRFFLNRTPVPIP